MFLVAIMKNIDSVEKKVGQVDERLGQLERSCLAILPSISNMKTALKSSAFRKIDKINTLNTIKISFYHRYNIDISYIPVKLQ